jgi:N-acetylmuramoyl-L-alanine amidase
MNVRINLLIAAGTLALALAGCQGPPSGGSGAILGQQSVTIRELAVRLGMEVHEQTDTFVILKNKANTVMIFTSSDARYFVNGKAIGPVGNVDKVRGEVSVPAALVEQIRSHLSWAAPPTTPTPTPRRGQRVIVDAGHGGHDPGTTAVNGIYEKHITLAVATKVASILRQRGYQVTMTRQDDRYIELEERAAIANRLGADLFVSIHADSAPDSTVQGSTTYVAEAASSDSMQAARSVITAMDTTGVSVRGVRRADYKVLIWTRCPAILVELGYLSNSQEAVRLENTGFQAKLATAVADGVINCLK